MLFFAHLFTPDEVLSFHSSYDAFPYCLILISIKDGVNVKFGGVFMF